MQTVIRRAYEANCILARGGLAQVTDEDRLKVSELLEFQFDRLERFAGQIVEEHWTATGRAIRKRSRMYVNSARQIFWYIETQNQKEIGGKWERWVLIGGMGDDGTCDDCIALSAKGWVEIGMLPQPCDGSTICLSSCRCGKRHSKAVKRPRLRGALRKYLEVALTLRMMGRLGFSPKAQGRSYPAPHCGAPGEVGGSRPREECASDIYDKLPWQLRPETSKAVFACLTHGLATGKESAIVLNRDGTRHTYTMPEDSHFAGRVLEHFKGTESSVAVASLDDAEDEFIWVHNHPNSSGLTPTDIWMLWRTDIVHMIAVGHDGALFHVSRMSDTLPEVGLQTVTNIWVKAYNDLKPYYASQVRRGLMSPEKAHRIMTVFAATAVADKCKLDYRDVSP